MEDEDGVASIGRTHRCAHTLPGKLSLTLIIYKAHKRSVIAVSGKGCMSETRLALSVDDMSSGIKGSETEGTETMGSETEPLRGGGGMLGFGWRIPHRTHTQVRPYLTGDILSDPDR